MSARGEYCAEARIVLKDLGPYGDGPEGDGIEILDSESVRFRLLAEDVARACVKMLARGADLRDGWDRAAGMRADARRMNLTRAPGGEARAEVSTWAFVWTASGYACGTPPSGGLGSRAKEGEVVEL